MSEPSFGIYFVNQDRLVIIDDAQAEVSPTEARERDVYFPNSENLAPDEMRVIACGTGMPTTRASQAAAFFLVEPGNGDMRGYHTKVHEFDYKGVNAVVYEANGVTIRSFPAIHSLDGPVSYGLESDEYFSE